MSLSPLIIEDLVKAALREDLGHGHDVTSEATVPGNAIIKAQIVAREDGVLAGLIVALSAFSLTSPDFDMIIHANDGDHIQAGGLIAEIEGPARSILTAERTALNFLSHMSGIATMTQKYCALIKETGAEICDTRKTLPGLRVLQKYSVLIGGGSNHRRGLDDAILIKDNHIAIAGGIEQALQRACVVAGHTLKIEIEVDTLDQLKEVLDFHTNSIGRVDIVMLDNMKVTDIKKAVTMCKDTGIVLEASGSITLDNIQDIAKTGVHYISVGALTHSAPSLDMALDITIDAQ